MSNAQDEFVLFSHAVYKLHWDHTRVVRLGELVR